jgi:hypothetical protein
VRRRGCPQGGSAGGHETVRIPSCIGVGSNESLDINESLTSMSPMRPSESPQLHRRRGHRRASRRKRFDRRPSQRSLPPLLCSPPDQRTRRCLLSSREYGGLAQPISHPLCSSSAPPQTLRRRDLLVSKTMRVVLSWSKKVAFNKPMFGSDSCAKYSSYRSIWIERQKWRTHHIKTICIVYPQTFLLCYCGCGCCCAFLL